VLSSGSGINALRISETWKLVTEGKYGGRGHLPEVLFIYAYGFINPHDFREIQTNEYWMNSYVPIFF
jgi:hypothetical protein